MSSQVVKAKADYGIDAPRVVRRFFILGFAGFFGGLALAKLMGIQSLLMATLIGTAVFGGAIWMLTACFMVFGSKVLKLRLRERLLDDIPWRGNEQVLDVGCGRGLMLIGAARRLTSGRAVGIDLWQAEDQSGNSPETTRSNAAAEGAGDRIEIRTGDARKLPFEAETFDVVLSSWALHNLYERTDREQALREIARVLKAGGRVVLVDIRHADEYAQVFESAGLEGVRISPPSFIFVIPSRVVTARKPPSRGSDAPVAGR
jgi:SAM-dependent methyltransferase